MLAFCGAMAYAELAALRPRAGGEYVYLREAYGPLAGFLTGWTSFVAGFTGAMAASAIVTDVLCSSGLFQAPPIRTPFFVIPLPYVPLTFSRQTLAGDRRDLCCSRSCTLRGVGPGRIGEERARRR